MQTNTRRTLLAGLPPVVAVLPTLVLLTAAGDRLPDPIPVHFGFSGVADNFADRWAVVVIHLAIGVLLGVVLGAAGRGGLDSMNGRALVGTSWATAGFLGPVQFGGVAAALDRADAVGAVLPGWTFPLAVVVAAVAGFVGYRLAPASTHPGGGSVPVAPLPVGHTEQVSWSRTVSSPLVLAVAGALAAGGAVATALGAPLVTAAGSVVLGALAAVTGTARVTVDRRGLTVAFGVLGVPRIRIPAADIAGVSTADVVPLTLGGWGYRIVPGGRAIVLRGGPALTVTRRSGRRLTVTVDDPETAAGLLAGISRC